MRGLTSHSRVKLNSSHPQPGYLNAAYVKRETWIINRDPYCTHTIPKTPRRFKPEEIFGTAPES
jgi:hypothetical protein